MKEQISAELLKLLQSANSATEGAASFLQQKLPELCHQVITWEIGLHSIFLFLLLIGVALLAWCAKLRWKHQVKQWVDNFNDCDWMWIISILAIFILFIPICVNLTDLSKALISPDLVVLDYFRHMR